MEGAYVANVMSTLTKKDIVINISNQTGMLQKDVLEVVQRTLDQIIDALARGDDVELRNFGVFDVRLVKPRKGRNPSQPGSTFSIPARATAKFKAGKIMKERVDGLTRKLLSGTGDQPPA